MAKGVKPGSSSSGFIVASSRIRPQNPTRTAFSPLHPFINAMCTLGIRAASIKFHLNIHFDRTAFYSVGFFLRARVYGTYPLSFQTSQASHHFPCSSLENVEHSATMGWVYRLSLANCSRLHKVQRRAVKRAAHENMILCWWISWSAWSLTWIHPSDGAGRTKSRKQFT